VRKPSKQHRFDCLASKLHSSVVTCLNCTLTRENVDGNTCWTRHMSTRTAQNGSRDGTKTYFHIYIKQCSDAYTAKTEKICEKKCIHRTAHARVEAACLYDYCADDVTRLKHVLATDCRQVVHSCEHCVLRGATSTRLTKKRYWNFIKQYIGLFQSKNDLIPAALPFSIHFCVQCIAEVSRGHWHESQSVSDYHFDASANAKVS